MVAKLVSGQQLGGEFVAMAEDTLASTVGFQPFNGTLNLNEVSGLSSLPRETVAEDFGDPSCEGAVLRPCRLGGIMAAVIRPLVPDYPDDLVELLAPVQLRPFFRLDDGDAVSIAPDEEAWRSAELTADPAEMVQFESVVFDLDGTLVDLAVDWTRVHEEVEARLGDNLEHGIRSYSENEIFDTAREVGVYDDLLKAIEFHELEGAKQATSKPLLDELHHLSCPIGICTANSKQAALLALDRFDVQSEVDALVARETVRPGKPDPGPLVTAFDRLQAEPGDSLFVGDEPTDAQTAVGAGSSFLKADLA